MIANQFVECDFCRNLLAGDLMCKGCLANRQTIANLTAEVLRLKGVINIAYGPHMPTRTVIVLRFVDNPEPHTSDEPGLVAVLERHGCPRDIAFRIADEIRVRGERIATVLDSVDVHRLTADLVPFKIAVENLGPRTQTWGEG